MWPQSNSSFLWWMVMNASSAYLTNLFNFLVTKYTSALTLQVSGLWARACLCVHTHVSFQPPTPPQTYIRSPSHTLTHTLTRSIHSPAHVFTHTHTHTSACTHVCPCTCLLTPPRRELAWMHWTCILACVRKGQRRINVAKCVTG